MSGSCFLGNNIGDYMLNLVKDWILARWSERTSWDGAIIIGVSLCVLLAAPIIEWLAWPALVYGIFTLVKEEVGK